jgi:hypothetical protein
MKIAKNMDSVFSNCTDDELKLDIFFDDDETIIDIIDGSPSDVNKYVEDSFDEANDMVGENPDFGYNDDNDNKLSNAEGSKDVDLEPSGELGSTETINKDSAEANAHDTKDEEEAIGMNDDQQSALEDVDFLLSVFNEDSEEGPLEDDDEAEREGQTSLGAVATEASDEAAPDEEPEGDPGNTNSDDPVNESDDMDDIEEVMDDDDLEYEDLEESFAILDRIDKTLVNESSDIDLEYEDLEESVSILDKIYEECDPIADGECPNDSDKRAGAACDCGTEGEEQEVLGAANKGNADLDDDIEDEDKRDGDVENNNDVEGVSTHTVAAALEDTEEDTKYIDSLLEALDNDEFQNTVDDDEFLDSYLDGIDINEANEVSEDNLVDEDDDDIEDIDNDKEPDDSNIEYDYDDDELIDAVLNGDITDI